MRDHGPGFLFIWLVLALFPVCATAQQSFFLSPITYPFSGSVSSFLLADVNGDGIPDLLVGSYDGGGEILVFLGKGHGDFAPPIVLQYGAVPLGLAVGDVNGDGKADIVAANGINKTVSILLGDGTGHFGGPTNITFSSLVFQVALADLNSDHKLDLIVSAQDEGTVAPGTIFVSLGDGHGGFSPFSQINTGLSQLNGFVLGDFNEDSKLDLAFLLGCPQGGGGTGVGVSLGDGTGNFGSPTFFATGLNNCDARLVSGDVNNDKHLDLVTFGTLSGGVGAQGAYVLLGDGTGKFTLNFGPPVSSGVNFALLSIQLGDVNGDGNLDLVEFLTESSFGRMEFALGDGKGNFTQTLDQIDLSNGPSPAILGDLNNDGHVDMIILEGVGPSVPGTLFVYMSAKSSPPLPSSVPSLVASPQNPPAGATVTLTADVQGAGGNPDGSVSFLDGNALLGTATVVDQTSGDGLATFTTSALVQGSHSITAQYSGSARFVASNSGSITVTVGPPLPPSTTTSLNSSVNPSSVGQAVTLTARVTSNGGTPSGLLTFLDGSTAIGSQQLDGTGSASMVVSSFTAGTHQLTATYAGSSGFQGSTSAVLFQQVSGIDPPGGNYALAASPSSATVNPGQSANFSITLSSTGGFTSAVSLVCQGLPANSQCQFSPSTISSSQPNTTLIVMTSGPNASLNPTGLNLPTALLGVPVLFGLVLAGTGGKRRKRALCLLSIMLAAMLCISCGGGGTPPPGNSPPPPVTPSGTSQVTVVGTSGNLSHQLPVTLIVK